MVQQIPWLELMSMQVSRIVKENLLIDSKSYNSLSPIMKDAITDVFSHNIEVKQLEDYFDKEVIEKLGE